MEISIEQTLLRDVFVVSPQVFEDDRGFFMEVFRADKYTEQKLPERFVQFNHSGSVKDTVRGLHFQWEPPMGKLMRVTRGRAFLAAVDIRINSPTLGKHFAITLSEQDRRLVWAPAGFARGFAVLSDYAEIQYLTTGIYNQRGESGILWNDPALGIKWPVPSPILSGKDAVAQTLDAWLKRPEAKYFRY